MTFLQQFQYKCSHVKGKDNIVPEALGRRPYEVMCTEGDKVIDKFPDLDSVSPFIRDSFDLWEAIEHPEPSIPEVQEATVRDHTKVLTQDPPVISSPEVLRQPPLGHAPRPTPILKNQGVRPANLKATCPNKPPPVFPQDHDKLGSLLNPKDRLDSSISTVTISATNTRGEKLRNQLTTKAKFYSITLT